MFLQRVMPETCQNIFKPGGHEVHKSRLDVKEHCTLYDSPTFRHMSQKPQEIASLEVFQGNYIVRTSRCSKTIYQVICKDTSTSTTNTDLAPYSDRCE